MGNREDDAEQLAGDRATIASLLAAGDDLTVPRPIDHYIYFASATQRTSFLAEALPLGFKLHSSHDEAPPPRSAMVLLPRTDLAELQHVHAVVMTLFRIANRHGGEYDGWESPIVRRASRGPSNTPA